MLIYLLQYSIFVVTEETETDRVVFWKFLGLKNGSKRTRKNGGNHAVDIKWWGGLFLPLGKCIHEGGDKWTIKNGKYKRDKRHSYG